MRPVARRCAAPSPPAFESGVSSPSAPALAAPNRLEARDEVALAQRLFEQLQAFGGSDPSSPLPRSCQRLRASSTSFGRPAHVGDDQICRVYHRHGCASEIEKTRAIEKLVLEARRREHHINGHRRGSVNEWHDSRSATKSGSSTLRSNPAVRMSVVRPSGFSGASSRVTSTSALNRGAP